MKNGVIGIIDSGVGGLTIWQEVIKKLPYSSTVYVADTKNCPYGGKQDEEIKSFAVKLVAPLIAQGIRFIVVACNTISVIALDVLRKEFPEVTFIGTVPAIKIASKLTQNRRIGILGTEATSKSRYLSNLIVEHANHHRVITVGTNKLVPFIEMGHINGKRLEHIIRTELRVFEKEEVDTLVLACSHYPFLKQLIEKQFKFRYIVDSGEAIAKRVKQVIHSSNNSSKPTHTILTSGDGREMRRVIKTLIGDELFRTIRTVRHVKL